MEKSKGLSPTSVSFIVAITAIIAIVFGITVGSSGAFDQALSKLSIPGIQTTVDPESLPADLDYSTVEELYDELRRNYDGELNNKDIMDGLKRGLAASAGDPYTTYLSPESAAEFNASLNGEFSGIGAEIAIKNNQLQVVAPLDNTPAAKAGLRPKDLIIAIDEVDTFSMTLEEAVTKIRGEAGTDVILTILRGRDQQEVTITRGKIVVPNASGEILEGNIGYIELNTFGDAAVSEVTRLANDFADKKVNGVILDMRNNSGGLLDASVNIAGLWLDNQVVVEQRSKDRPNDALRSGKKGPLGGIPTVVLINGGSASASEIVAGALQDYDVAHLIGEKSFGKGSVQTLEEFSNGGVLKVTIARWYTPKGTNIDKEGITPDTVIELTEKDFDADRDPQLDAALKKLR